MRQVRHEHATINLVNYHYIRAYGSCSLFSRTPYVDNFIEYAVINLQYAYIVYP